MKRKIAIIGLLLTFSLFLNYASGQDTLSVRSDLKIKRAADSALAVEFFKKAQTFYSADNIDSASVNISKSVDVAKQENFMLVAAVNYELLASIYEAQNNWEETLRNYIRASSAYSKLGDKKNEARILHIIAEKYFLAGSYKKSAQNSEQEFILYEEQNSKMRASTAEMAGKSYYYLPIDSLSTKWYNIAASYFKKDTDTAGFLRCSEKLGSLFIQIGNYDKANNEYENILSIYSQKNDYKNIAAIYNQLGFLAFKKKDLSSALSNFQNAVESSEKGGKDDYFLTDAWSNIAVCHQNLNNQKEMLQSFQEALKHAKDSERKDEAARIERILAMIYFKKGDYYHAEVYCRNCIESAKASGNFDILQLCYKDYSAVLESGNDFVKALEYYEKHLNLRDSLIYESRLTEKKTADRINELESIEQRLRNELSTEEIQGLELKNLKAESSRKENEIKLLQKQQELDRSEKGRLEQSLVLERERFELNRKVQDIKSLKQQQAIDSLSLKQKDDEAKNLETEKILLQTQIEQQRLKAQKDKQIRNMAVGLGALMVIVALMILAGLISTRRQNQRLAESKRQIEKVNADLEIKNAEVLKQKDIIEQKNQSITDSIQYASRIQTAVLPPINFLQEWGIENFILFKPKDIVSGDFYWGVRKNGKIIIAAGDCTGHGVPGAFMSMLGHAFLDEIINTKEIKNAAAILNLLRDEVIITLKQKGTTGEARDGMDISLVILDLKAGVLDYAGANNPLYIIRDGKMLKFAADRMPIGIHFISFTPFTNQKIEIRKGDYLYLFSDGYADQFGGPKGKKYMYKPFQYLLLQNHSKPLQTQKEVLDDTFEKWKGDRDQVDDVMVIGIHL
ncbi:MAG: SpoIIE family protein phosphatase [Bacteroidia bacterium]|nr:SpoIIE family protein phosphatase [Bacteroidia bacterium]